MIVMIIFYLVYLNVLRQDYNSHSHCTSKLLCSYNLRTVIVTADIHQGLYSQSSVLRHSTPIFDLLALVRCHPLYILLRVRRELCF